MSTAMWPCFSSPSRVRTRTRARARANLVHGHEALLQLLVPLPPALRLPKRGSAHRPRAGPLLRTTHSLPRVGPKPPLVPAPNTELDSTSIVSSLPRISSLSRFGGEASESRIRWTSPLPSPFVSPFRVRVTLDFLFCLISTSPSPSLEVSPCCIRVPRPCAF